MKHAISVVAAVATLSIGSVATAAEHVILVMSDGYFPQITYISPGDSVQFLNVSTSNQSIIAKNDSWVLGPIAPDTSATLIVDESVQKTFYNADLTDEDGVYSIEGNMSFSTAPLN